MVPKCYIADNAVRYLCLLFMAYYQSNQVLCNQMLCDWSDSTRPEVSEVLDELEDDELDAGIVVEDVGNLFSPSLSFSYFKSGSVP